MTTRLSSLTRNIQDLKSKYEEIIECKKDLYCIAITYAQLEYKSDQETKRFINECNYCNDNIKELTTEISEKINNINDGYLKLGPCQYDGHCNDCAKRSKNDYIYCYDECIQCGFYRKYDDKDKELACKEYYFEHINQRCKLQDKPQRKNTTIINNNLTVNINNCINTKDLFFYVTITSSQENANEKLRYIFTFLMCGCYARKFFPDEPKYSKALTYPVVAAKYDIVTHGCEHVLHGVLRYEYIKSITMTVKKLEGMSGGGVTVKANIPNIYNNNKYSLSKNDIDYFITMVTHSKNGSNIDNFYIQDVDK